jgi:hypothetical protein
MNAFTMVHVSTITETIEDLKQTGLSVALPG